MSLFLFRRFWHKICNGCNLVAKTSKKTKLRRMSGIPPQYLNSIVRYRANIKYHD